MIGTEPANEGVRAPAPIERVIPRAAIEHVGNRIPRDRIVPRPAERVLYDRGLVDADIVDETADIAEAAGREIDDLVLAVARAIERIVAAGIVDRQRRRRPIAGKVEDRAGSRIEAVGRIAATRRGRSVDG